MEDSVLICGNASESIIVWTKKSEYIFAKNYFMYLLI